MYVRLALVTMLVRALAAEEKPREHDHGYNSGPNDHPVNASQEPGLPQWAVVPEKAVRAGTSDGDR
jgi:hypothetical protein